ncbi:phage tail length tape measure family protein [Rhodanobacter sp. AS-Z3]|uniref:phage tail length tape measure family protein n=1 Tax=Rhodanobacter sp. AS-Z3 TaxID=3031330 RepID=UPI002478F9F6|nr:phage tail length tape measure family protein [Rhodanobacter sp. AS-Z3]WEN13703.1 phage tail length tape measure family protein [Rhodanobacter sp. AS-Z3]
MAVQDYELLLRVRADLLEAISGLKGLTTELGQGDAAAKQLGNTADTTAAKVDALAQSLKARDDANARSFDATARAAQQSKQVIADMDAEAAAHKRAGAAAQAYRDAESARGTANTATLERTAALAAQRTEMAKLAGQIDPTVNAMARLDAQERSLNAMRKAGVVGMEDYTRFKAVIDANRLSIGGAAKSMHKFSLNTQQTRLEMGRLIKDISTGQWGRLASTGTTLANQAGFISLLFSPLGLAIGAVVGSLGAFAVALEKGYQEEEKINQAIVVTGNYAGVTVGQIDALAASMGAVSGKTGQARDILTGLIATGKFTGESLQSVGQAAADMAAVTGKSAAEVVAQFSKFADDPVKAAMELDGQYHILNTTIYEQIKALQDSGDKFGALEVLAKRFTDETGKNFDELRSHMSWYEKFVDRFSTDNGFSRLFDWAKNLGRPTTELDTFRAALEKYNSVYDTYQASLTGSSTKDRQEYLFAASQQAYKELQAAQKAAQGVQAKALDDGTQKRLDSAAVSADAKLDALQKSMESKADKVKDKIKELNQAYTDLWGGADPNNPKLKGVQRFIAEDGNVSYAGGQYDKDLANINAMDKGSKGPRGRSQASIDQAADAALQKLIEGLGSLQGKLDPTAAAWAAYNKEVDNANKLAVEAKTHGNANIAMINGLRDARIAEAATVRDAAIAEEADKDRNAYEKLRDSIKDVDNVSLGKAFAQLKQLNDELARGTITQREHDDTAGAIVDANIPKSLHYKGLDAVVGGPFGEVNKADRALEDQQKNYQKQLDALNKFHDAKQQSDADFVAKENALKKENDAEVQAIQEARQQAMLMGITSSFASAADAIKQGFGEQSKAYRAAFALSKAAAIAQATVGMFMDISHAIDKGWPQNIPLIAQATAEGIGLIGSIRSLTAGYREGGYTGPGGVDQPAGTVHAGEVVWSQKDIARAGGVGMVEAMRLGMIGYADGGVVGAFASAADFPRGPTPGMPRNTVEKTGAPTNNMRVYVVQNEDQLLQRLSQHPAMEKAVVAIAGENGTAIRAKW